MYTESFDLGTTPLTITTQKELKEQLLEQIFRTIQFIRYDFNLNIHNSSGYRFAQTKPNVPIFVSNEFTHFLTANIFFTEQSEKQFLPFVHKEDVELKTYEITKLIDIEENSVIKKKDIFLQTKHLLQPYIIDTVFDILKSNKIKDFLVHTDYYYRCDSVNKWIANFEVEEEEINIEIKNNCAALHYNEQFEEQLFSKENTSQIIKNLIISTQTAQINKVVATEIIQLSNIDQIKDYIKNNELNAILFNKDDKIIN